MSFTHAGSTTLLTNDFMLVAASRCELDSADSPERVMTGATSVSLTPNSTDRMTGVRALVRDAASRRSSHVGRRPGLPRGAGNGDACPGSCRAFGDVLVVDDGSDDDTASQALGAGATVIRHPLNLGQGAAIQTGISFAPLAQGAEVSATFDADGQHDANDLVRMHHELVQSGCDMVIGGAFLVTPMGCRRSVAWF